VAVAFTPLLALRLFGPLILACVAAWSLDALSRRKGLQPPGFRQPWRRSAAFVLVAAVLWIGVFEPLGEIGLVRKVDLANLSTPQLFLLHALMVAAALGWFLLGFAGEAARRPLVAALPVPGVEPQAPLASDSEAVAVEPPVEPPADIPPPSAIVSPADLLPPAPRVSLGRTFLKQFGLVTFDLPRELVIGLGLGAAAWGVVLCALLVVAIIVLLVGGQDALPKPSAVVPWIAALPVAVRVLVSLSAGVVEEIFFRGFLQPRIGIALSTGFFVLAHVSYGQPLMLVGITLLSLIYGFLVRWRQTVWPAIAAHALFDGVQLLVIIPMAMRLMGRASMSIW
jgi:membrane protease YdiL (CAAX protease family)